MREISRAGIVAGILMALVYCGLAQVGASFGSVMPNATNGAALLTASATLHFGIAGTVIIAAIYLLACLNVCIGLISCCGTYFAETFGAAARCADAQCWAVSPTQAGRRPLPFFPVWSQTLASTPS